MITLSATRVSGEAEDEGESSWGVDGIYYRLSVLVQTQRPSKPFSAESRA